MPDLYRHFIESWRSLHPRWEFRWWDESNLPPLQNWELWEAAPRIAPRAVEQFRSDVARYELLQRFGGVWVDVDFRCQKPIDVFMGRPWVVRHARRFVANGIIGVPPDHPAMAEAIENLPAIVERHPGRANTWLSGPRYFTPIAHRHDFRILPGEWFLPYEWNELERGDEDFPDAWAVHHWNNQRRQKGLL